MGFSRASTHHSGSFCGYSNLLTILWVLSILCKLATDIRWVVKTTVNLSVSLGCFAESLDLPTIDLHTLPESCMSYNRMPVA